MASDGCDCDFTSFFCSRFIQRYNQPMLSYRHAFHAGNHADVLKHFLLVDLIRHLRLKDKAFWVIDSHAGAGQYSLNSGYALQLAEYEQGIGRLWSRQDLPPALENYVEMVRQANPDGQLRHYPGSPRFALSMLRSQDRLRLFELHSTDARLLRQDFAASGRQVVVTAGDGYAGLRALLPPQSRRGLVLIDPSYEEKADYSRVIAALEDGLARFATGIYALWYPLLEKRESISLPRLLKQLPAGRWLNVTLRVRDVGVAGYGMAGSGMFVINPPWQLAQTLRDTLPYMTSALAQDTSAGYSLEAEG